MTEIETNIIAAVKLLRLHPTELLKGMRCDYNEAAMRDALSNLISLGYIILSSDRYLEVPIAYPDKSNDVA